MRFRSFLLDSETGLPLTEWLNKGGSIQNVCFDPSGQRIAVVASGARVWKVPEAARRERAPF